MTNLISRRGAIGSLFAVIASTWFLGREAEAAAAFKARLIDALVIGMRYDKAPAGFRLANTFADAKAIDLMLRRIPNSRVTLLDDPNLSDFTSAVNAYLEDIGSDRIALIYYAGHGVQIDGLNYLVSGRAEALIPISDIILRVREKAKIVLIFLDACRNNPFASAYGEAGQGRSVQIAHVTAANRPAGASRSIDLNAIPIDSPRLKTNQGLAQFPLRGRGVKIIFSTDPGNVALDGVGEQKNSPFNRSLVKELSQPKSLEDVLTDVTRDVVSETKGQQTPWSQGSLDEVVFISGAPKRYESGDVMMPIP